jgi:hypothetical protein
MKKISMLLALLAASAAQAAPVVTFQWDAYLVDSTHNTGANKFVLETKIDGGAFVASPDITPITATTIIVDLAGRAGTTVTGRIKACRPGTFASPPIAGDECSAWSNEATKVIAAPGPPINLRIQ